MQVFNQVFIDAIKDKLETLQPGFYMTREQLCMAIGVSPVYMNAVSIVLADEAFNGFESVKSRGIRRKKEVSSPVAAAEPATETV